jgi:cysteine synthase A
MTTDWSSFSTPLVRLSRISPGQLLFAKLEHLQPTGSVFDRIAHPILKKREAELRASAAGAGRPVVVAGSGSFCLSFAAAHAALALGEIVVVCPASTLAEHRVLLTSHGVKMLYSDAALGIQGCYARAEVEAKARHAVLISPITIEDEAEELFEGTVGAELVEVASTNSEVARANLVITAFESNALIAGAARALERAKHVVTAVGTVRARGDEGIHQDGALSELEATPRKNVELVTVSDRDAHSMRIELARKEGLLVGLASAGALFVAHARAKETPQHSVLAIIVDAGDRYFSVDHALGALGSEKATSKPGSRT